MSEEEITVVLLGTVGIGKSATGNTLTDMKDSNFMISESLLFEKRFKDDDQYKWHIFETPGIWNVERLEHPEGLKELSDDMTRLIQHIEQRKLKGITTFLFVFNIHGRFGQEDKKVTKFYEHIFGKDEFWKHCIIVYTGGDSFEGDFDEWIEEQTGEFETLINLCDKRLVLISSSNDQSSRERLKTKIIKHKNEQNQCYTLNDMQNTKLRTSLVPRSEVFNFENICRNKIKNFTRELSGDTDIHKKWEVVKKMTDLENEIRKRVNGSGQFESLLSEFNSVIRNFLSESKNGTCVVF